MMILCCSTALASCSLAGGRVAAAVNSLRPREPAAFTTAQAGNDSFIFYSRGMLQAGKGVVQY